MGSNTIEFGATTADARRLARRVKHVYLRYPVSLREHDTEIFMMSRAAFLASTRYAAADGRMPSELYELNGEIYFVIGSYGVMLHQRDQAAAERNAEAA